MPATANTTRASPPHEARAEDEHQNKPGDDDSRGEGELRKRLVQEKSLACAANQVIDHLYVRFAPTLNLIIHHAFHRLA